MAIVLGLLHYVFLALLILLVLYTLGLMRRHMD